jgi:hypothetical protein
MSAATLTPRVDVAAVEVHLSRYAVACPLCKAVSAMGVAQHVCGLGASDGSDDEVEVVLIVCKRCGYLMPLAAERILASAAPLAA